jgi:hypothetical protein
MNECLIEMTYHNDKVILLNYIILINREEYTFQSVKHDLLKSK